MDLFTSILYTVEKIDGDYAYLLPEGGTDLNPVARALLPGDIGEGSRVLWEALSYRLLDD